MTTTAAVVVTSAVGVGTTSMVAGGRAVAAECHRESSLLFLLLVLGTVWLGLSLYNFTKTLVARRVFGDGSKKISIPVHYSEGTLFPRSAIPTVRSLTSKLNPKTDVTPAILWRDFLAQLCHRDKIASVTLRVAHCNFVA